MKVLITGVGGTGKTTLAKALNERGVPALDLHDVPDLFSWKNKETGEKVEYTPVHSRDWFDVTDRFCNIDRLKEVLSENPDVVMAGVASGNQEEFFACFDKVILLQCSSETIVHRMQTRTNKSGYGKTKAEQDDNVEWQKEYDAEVLAYGAIPVSTEGDIDNVVDKIVEVIRQ